MGLETFGITEHSLHRMLGAGFELERLQTKYRCADAWESSSARKPRSCRIARKAPLKR